MSQAPQYPTATSSTRWGDTRVDEFAYLRDTQSAAFADWVRAQNAACAAQTADQAALRRRLSAERRSRMPDNPETVPVRRAGWLWFQRQASDQDFPVYLRQPVDRAGEPQGPAEVILDLNALAAQSGYAMIKGMAISDEGQTMAYCIDTTGAFVYTLYLVDLRDGSAISAPISHAVTPTFAAAPKAGQPQVLWFVEQNPADGRAWRLASLEVGAPPESRQIVLAEEDARYMLSVRRSRKGQLAFLTAESSGSTEVHLLDATTPASPPRCVAPRQPDLRYTVEEGVGDCIYVLTNDEAPTQRLMSTSRDHLAREAWVEVIPARPDVVLTGVEAFADRLVLLQRVDGAPSLATYDLSTGQRQDIPLPGGSGALTPEPNPDFESPAYRFSFSAPLLPPVVLELRGCTVDTLQAASLAQPVDPRRYDLQRVDVKAADGTLIPLTVVRRKGQRRGGPGLLYAYGAYGWPLDDAYNPSYLCLVDRGLTVAFAHVRGGGEKGAPWHDDGRLLVKRNTLLDLLACADWLFDQRWVARGRLALKGLSAGGLTVFAAFNRAPEGFACLVGESAFVDVLTPMLEPDLPGTVLDYEEWGNPQEAVYYQTIRAYCPYTNLRPLSYPPILLTTSLSDSQVPVWIPARFAARAQRLNLGPHPVLISIDTSAAGHTGPSSRSAQNEAEAFWLAFVLHSLGRRAV